MRFSQFPLSWCHSSSSSLADTLRSLGYYGRRRLCSFPVSTHSREEETGGDDHCDGELLLHKKHHWEHSNGSSSTSSREKYLMQTYFSLCSSACSLLDWRNSEHWHFCYGLLFSPLASSPLLNSSSEIEVTTQFWSRLCSVLLGNERWIL